GRGGTAGGMAPDRRASRRLPDSVLLGRPFAAAPGGVRGRAPAVARRGLERAVARRAGGCAGKAAGRRHRAGPRSDDGAAGEGGGRVVARHGVFRTAFVWDGLSRPLQVVCEGARLPWREEDGSGRSRGEQVAALEKLRADDIEQGFGLMTAPLCRFVLARLA